MYLLVFQHIPVKRTTGLIADVTGAQVSTGWVASLLGQAHGLVTDSLRLIRALLTLAHVLHVDETTTRTRNRRCWLHMACTEHLTLLGPAPRSRPGAESLGVPPGFISGCHQSEEGAASWLGCAFLHRLGPQARAERVRSAAQGLHRQPVDAADPRIGLTTTPGPSEDLQRYRPLEGNRNVFALWPEWGLPKPDFDIADDLSNLEDVVDFIFERKDYK